MNFDIFRICVEGYLKFTKYIAEFRNFHDIVESTFKLSVQVKWNSRSIEICSAIRLFEHNISIEIRGYSSVSEIAPSVHCGNESQP